jgi:hypothetical protein
MYISTEIVRIENGKEVSCGLKYSTIGEYLERAVVRTLNDVRDITELAEAYMELLETGVDLAIVERRSRGLMKVINRIPDNPKVIEHQPQRAIPFQKSPEEVRVSREGRWRD